MNTQLSKKQAKIRIGVIALFYLMSGIFEYFGGLTAGDMILPKNCFLLDAYFNYSVKLGLITIFVGIGLLLSLLFRIRIIRWLALILAWWNLFTGPAIYIWWDIYSIWIKGFLSLTPSIWAWIFSIAQLCVIAVIRIYIIRTLSVDRAGHIFIRNKKSNDTQFKVKW